MLSYLVFFKLMVFSCFQLLLRSGRSPAEALMVLVPEAYKKHPTLSIKYPEVHILEYQQLRLMGGFIFPSYLCIMHIS